MSNAINKLLAMVNRDNAASLPSSLTESQVAISVAAANTNAKVSRDTQVTLTAKPGAPYRNKVTVYYNRIDLAEFAAADGAPILQIAGVVDIASILAAFNEVYGSALELSDLRSDHVIPPQEDILDGEDFILYASATSLAYRGNVTVHLQPADVDLDVAITEKNLNGLVFKLPAEPAP